MQTATTAQQTIPTSHQETIFVIRRDELMKHGHWQGIRSDHDWFLPCATTHKEFHPRYLMEQDPTYKQIIPYVIFTHDNKYFLMQRTAHASENRLANKYTLGIGGHIREQDIQHADFFSWAIREFNEEVAYNGNITHVTCIGLINDDTSEVGKVHMGIALLITGDTDDIDIKSELAHGSLESLDECVAKKDSMETWSQYIVEILSR